MTIKTKHHNCIIAVRNGALFLVHGPNQFRSVVFLNGDLLIDPHLPAGVFAVTISEGEVDGRYGLMLENQQQLIDPIMFPVETELTDSEA